MEMSDTIGAISAALAAAQAAIGGAVKGKVNPAFKSKYADLSSVWDAWQAVGPAQGLSITQLPGAIVDGKVALTTILAHKSGEWMRETSHIQVGKSDAQGYVSAVTYGRRCALSAFVGIAPEDDDGNAAVRNDGRAYDTRPVRDAATRAAGPPDDTSPAMLAIEIEKALRAAVEKPALDAAWRNCRAERDRLKDAEPDLHARLLGTFEACAKAIAAKANPQHDEVLADEIPF